MKEFVNDQLKNALEEFQRTASKEANNQVIFALLSGYFMVPASWDKEPIRNEKGETVFQKDTQFQLTTVETTDGRRFFPIFSSKAEFDRWKNTDTKALVFTFDQFIPFVSMAKDSIAGIVIDPFGANMPFGTKFLLGLQNHPKHNPLEEKQIKKGEPVTLRDPIQDVTDLKEMIVDFCLGHASIKSVYLKERVVKEKPSHWFLVVDMEPENVDLFKDLGEACRSVNHGKEFEFIFASMNLAKKIMENNTPIYQKDVL